MPRIAEARWPAEPHSDEQKERYRRMLRAAAKLGNEHGLERMQMADVAKEAGVAIATLYRYFPSKTDLFVGLLNSQVRHIDQHVIDPTDQPSERVASLLVATGRQLLQRPNLATAMLQSNSAAQLRMGREHTVTSAAFNRLIVDALGLEEPDDEDLRMVRIIEQTWYGVLVSVLNGLIDSDQAEDDVRLASRLLLGGRYDEEENP